MTEQQSYILGMCNINKSEVAYRRKAMYFGIAVAVVLLALMLFFMINIFVRLILFVPIFIAAIGYLQVKNTFCVSYGASGKQNATDGHAGAEAVTDTEARVADKKKARTMNLQAAGISVVITALLLLVPNL